MDIYDKDGRKIATTDRPRSYDSGGSGFGVLAFLLLFGAVGWLFYAAAKNDPALGENIALALLIAGGIAMFIGSQKKW